MQRIGDDKSSSSGKLRTKLPRNLRIEKTLLSRGKRSKATKVGRIKIRRKIRIHYEIRFEGYKNDQNLLGIQESSKILTHRSVMAVLQFLIKLIFPRVQESQAANQERRELHELI